jgi:hypothetical protein
VIAEIASGWVLAVSAETEQTDFEQAEIASSGTQISAIHKVTIKAAMINAIHQALFIRIEHG